MTDLIVAESLTKYFNRHKPEEICALENVSLVVKNGEVLVINGASGSGKTTLLSLIGCMARPSVGKITIEKREISKLPERFLTEIRRKTFGFIFQQFNLIRSISVRENILLPLYPDNIQLLEMNRRVEEVMEKLQIGHKARMKVSALSGGEQQRVAIARALINDPKVVIADEPTAHLDSRLSGELLAILSDLHREGRTIIIATHDPFVSEHSLVSRCVKMRDGMMLSEAN